jgi:HEPN domain-containing protein
MADQTFQDLRRVQLLLAADPPDVERALFHCQQAAEKAFKAFLTWPDVPFRRVHDLDVTGGQCADLDPTLKDVADRAGALTTYAWQFRYPGAPYRPEFDEGTGALALAREIAVGIASRLPAEVQP